MMAMICLVVGDGDLIVMVDVGAGVGRGFLQGRLFWKSNGDGRYMSMDDWYQNWYNCHPRG